MPHHIGACPATTKIRVFYQAQGKGEIRIRVSDGSGTIYDSAKIAVDAKNGKQHHDFEIATPKARSEEHTSELQSLMRISYAVFCLKKKKNYKPISKQQTEHSKKPNQPQQ